MTTAEAMKQMATRLPLAGRLLNTASRLLGGLKNRRARAFIRVRESVPLGEKRFIAVVDVGNRRFLLGGGSNSVVMLAALDQRQQGGADEAADIA